MGTKLHREVTYGGFSTANTTVQVTFWVFGKTATIEASVTDWEKDTSGNWASSKRVEFERNYSDPDAACIIYEDMVDKYFHAIEIAAYEESGLGLDEPARDCEDEVTKFEYHLEGLKGCN